MGKPCRKAPWLHALGPLGKTAPLLAPELLSAPSGVLSAPSGVLSSGLLGSSACLKLTFKCFFY